MNSLLSKFPSIAQATSNEKLAMIDELWESVRRSGDIPIPKSHLVELERRVNAVAAEPSIVLDPKEARAFFRP